VKSTLKRRLKELEIVKREAYEAIDRGREFSPDGCLLPASGFGVVTGEKSMRRSGRSGRDDRSRADGGSVRFGGDSVRGALSASFAASVKPYKFRVDRGRTVPRKRRKRPGGRAEGRRSRKPEGSFVREIGGRRRRVGIRRPDRVPQVVGETASFDPS